MLKSVYFTPRQVEQLAKNEMRLRRAIRVSLLDLKCFASSGMNEGACARALGNASRHMTELVRSCKMTIASAKKTKPDLIIVHIGTVDPDDTLENFGPSTISPCINQNRRGQDPDSDNKFNGAERRKRCAEWDAEIAVAIDTVREIEDMLLIHSMERRHGHTIFMAIASFLSALQRQWQYLLETEVARQTEIRVEYESSEGDDPTPIS